MAQQEMVNLLKKDVAKFNQFRKENRELAVDLKDADLHGAHLGGAELSRADMTNANLKGADLAGAFLVHTNLEGANLQEANLTGATLHQATLHGADLTRAKMGSGQGECRMCLHPDTFQGVNWDKEHLEELLRVLNLNKRWTIKYQITPKS